MKEVKKILKYIRVAIVITLVSCLVMQSFQGYALEKVPSLFSQEKKIEETIPVNQELTNNQSTIEVNGNHKSFSQLSWWEKRFEEIGVGLLILQFPITLIIAAIFYPFIGLASNQDAHGILEVQAIIHSLQSLWTIKSYRLANFLKGMYKIKRTDVPLVRKYAFSKFKKLFERMKNIRVKYGDGTIDPFLSPSEQSFLQQLFDSKELVLSDVEAIEKSMKVLIKRAMHLYAKNYLVIEKSETLFSAPGMLVRDPHKEVFSPDAGVQSFYEALSELRFFMEFIRDNAEFMDSTIKILDSSNLIQLIIDLSKEFDLTKVLRGNFVKSALHLGIIGNQQFTSLMGQEFSGIDFSSKDGKEILELAHKIFVHPKTGEFLAQGVALIKGLETHVDIVERVIQTLKLVCEGDNYRKKDKVKFIATILRAVNELVEDNEKYKDILNSVAGAKLFFKDKEVIKSSVETFKLINQQLKINGMNLQKVEFEVKDSFKGIRDIRDGLNKAYELFINNDIQKLVKWIGSESKDNKLFQLMIHVAGAYFGESGDLKDQKYIIKILQKLNGNQEVAVLLKNIVDFFDLLSEDNSLLYEILYFYQLLKERELHIGSMDKTEVQRQTFYIVDGVNILMKIINGSNTTQSLQMLTQRIHSIAKYEKNIVQFSDVLLDLLGFEIREYRGTTSDDSEFLIQLRKYPSWYINQDCFLKVSNYFQGIITKDFFLELDSLNKDKLWDNLVKYQYIDSTGKVLKKFDDITKANDMQLDMPFLHYKDTIFALIKKTKNMSYVASLVKDYITALEYRKSQEPQNEREIDAFIQVLYKVTFKKNKNGESKIAIQEPSLFGARSHWSIKILKGVLSMLLFPIDAIVGWPIYWISSGQSSCNILGWFWGQERKAWQRPLLLALMFGQNASNNPLVKDVELLLNQLFHVNKNYDQVYTLLRSTNPFIKQCVLIVFGIRGKNNVMKDAVSAVTHEDSGVRYAAAYVLGQIREKKGIQALLRLLFDQDEYVRTMAKASLENIVGKEHLARLLKEEEYQRIKRDVGVGQAPEDLENITQGNIAVYENEVKKLLSHLDFASPNTSAILQQIQKIVKNPNAQTILNDIILLSKNIKNNKTQIEEFAKTFYSILEEFESGTIDKGSLVLSSISLIEYFLKDQGSVDQVINGINAFTNMMENKDEVADLVRTFKFINQNLIQIKGVEAEKLTSKISALRVQLAKVKEFLAKLSEQKDSEAFLGIAKELKAHCEKSPLLKVSLDLVLFHYFGADVVMQKGDIVKKLVAIYKEPKTKKIVTVLLKGINAVQSNEALLEEIVKYIYLLAKDSPEDLSTEKRTELYLSLLSKMLADERVMRVYTKVSSAVNALFEDDTTFAFVQNFLTQFYKNTKKTASIEDVKNYFSAQFKEIEKKKESKQVPVVQIKDPKLLQKEIMALLLEAFPQIDLSSSQGKKLLKNIETVMTHENTIVLLKEVVALISSARTSSNELEDLAIVMAMLGEGASANINKGRSTVTILETIKEILKNSNELRDIRAVIKELSAFFLDAKTINATVNILHYLNAQLITPEIDLKAIKKKANTMINSLAEYNNSLNMAFTVFKNQKIKTLMKWILKNGKGPGWMRTSLHVALEFILGTLSDAQVTVIIDSLEYLYTDSNADVLLGECVDGGNYVMTNKNLLKEILIFVEIMKQRGELKLLNNRELLEKINESLEIYSKLLDKKESVQAVQGINTLVQKILNNKVLISKFTILIERLIGKTVTEYKEENPKKKDMMQSMFKEIIPFIDLNTSEGQAFLKQVEKIITHKSTYTFISELLTIVGSIQKNKKEIERMIAIGIALYQDTQFKTMNTSDLMRVGVGTLLTMLQWIGEHPEDFGKIVTMVDKVHNEVKNSEYVGQVYALFSLIGLQLKKNYATTAEYTQIIEKVDVYTKNYKKYSNEMRQIIATLDSAKTRKKVASILKDAKENPLVKLSFEVVLLHFMRAHNYSQEQGMLEKLEAVYKDKNMIALLTRMLDIADALEEKGLVKQGIIVFELLKKRNEHITTQNLTAEQVKAKTTKDVLSIVEVLLEDKKALGCLKSTQTGIVQLLNNKDFIDSLELLVKDMNQFTRTMQGENASNEKLFQHILKTLEQQKNNEGQRQTPENRYTQEELSQILAKNFKELQKWENHVTKLQEVINNPNVALVIAEIMSVVGSIENNKQQITLLAKVVNTFTKETHFSRVNKVTLAKHIFSFLEGHIVDFNKYKKLDETLTLLNNILSNDETRTHVETTLALVIEYYKSKVYARDLFEDKIDKHLQKFSEILATIKQGYAKSKIPEVKKIIAQVIKELKNDPLLAYALDDARSYFLGDGKNTDTQEIVASLEKIYTHPRSEVVVKKLITFLENIEKNKKIIKQVFLLKELIAQRKIEDPDSLSKDLCPVIALLLQNEHSLPILKQLNTLLQQLLSEDSLLIKNAPQFTLEQLK